MEHYKFNPITRTLVMSAGFARAISDIRSDEYNLYKQMLADVPGDCHLGASGIDIFKDYQTFLKLKRRAFRLSVKPAVFSFPILI